MERALDQWPDGHRLTADRWQWIVHHPRTCENAHRGPKGSYAYAKQTYFTQEANAKQELRDCHLARATSGARPG